MTLKQWDFVLAWNYKQPKHKVYTRFLHRLEGITPPNVCVSPQTLETYPKKIHLARFDMVVPAEAAWATATINWKKYYLIPIQ